MANTRDVTLEDGGIDKTFTLVKPSAMASEKLAWRAILMLGAAGFKSPAGGLGMIAALKSIFDATEKEKKLDELLQAFFNIDFFLIEPVLDDLLTYIKFRTPAGIARDLKTDNEGDVESPVTLFKLRIELIKFTAGF